MYPGENPDAPKQKLLEAERDLVYRTAFM